MLTIRVGEEEFFDESLGDEGEFIIRGGTEARFEHSLAALSKWESIHEKPFLGEGEKTNEELLDYIRCMIVTPDFPPEAFDALTEKNLEAINDYMNSKQTATWFSDDPGAPKSREVITADLIYHWMIEFSIPFECQNWHIHRLFTLIKVRNAKLAKPKKMNAAEAAQRRYDENERRKKQLGTSG